LHPEFFWEFLMRKLVFVIFAAVALLSFGCDEVGGVEECDENELCLEWEMSCEGDSLYLYCDETGYECKASCERVCAMAGFSGYAGDCSYNEQIGNDNCWCEE